MKFNRKPVLFVRGTKLRISLLPLLRLIHLLPLFLHACEPSFVAHGSRRDDWDDAMYVSASKEARYMCPFPACTEHFGSTSGIRHHWKVMHPNVPVPELHAARTRIRVDASDAVTELRNVVADRASALAADGQQWRSLQAAQPPPASVRAS